MIKIKDLIRKSAEWKYESPFYSCSNCNKTAPYFFDKDGEITYWPELNFCPYCGCVMNK